MKIVVLDGYTVNPGDLTWDDLKALGPCEIYDRTPPDQVLRRAAESEVLLTNKTEITRKHIQNLAKLKYIGITATGTNIVDLGAARERGIVVSNVPAYGTSSVAQTTIALLLELTQNVGLHSQSVHQRRWTSSLDWCYWERPLIELDGLTMGIIGLGRIGAAVARVGVALNALAAALNSGKLAGAGLDVLSEEPPPANNLLLTARNCVITPHLAWATKAARSRLMHAAVENVHAFLCGKPQNVVN